MIWRILELGWAGVLLIGLPVSSRALGRRLREAPVERMDMYASAVLSHVLLLVPTLLLDLKGDRAGVHLLFEALPWPRFLLWTLGTLGACVAMWMAMLLESKMHPGTSDDVVLAMLPRTKSEMAAFSGVSLTAGFAEEYLLRGFCLAIVALVTGSMWLGAAVTTLSFGMAHIYQGPRGAVRAAALGAVLAIPVVVTGSLVPSIVGHAATDLISGRWTLSILRRWGVATN
ncbi:MAG: CPBP family intramembrane metalloprotease [Acidobacteriota bacterium]|nr:CPBP family intramembrane metalloprotease [Acidobacteriota bacterium]